ncbi:hypothetical protein [Microbacterium sp. H1-D42]|uniref:hypothetical protein n=1 Tax=Microbacterium sp. H1-D42 TaxID=2925844 RepID=UPI001F5397C6|nr:hypothetical protein [Microbacterium sp. H1-D42]UNK72218.1 hypothetical protein MNR00_07185 [Microbacterium sp. H1-D42]
MSTSDQDGHARLTRKQLREIRLTGSTPVITDEEAARAAATPAQPAVVPTPPAPEPSAPVASAPVASAPEPSAPEPESSVPLTRREMREQERVRTDSVPVQEAPAPQPSAPAVHQPVVEAAPAMVSGVPAFAPARPPMPAPHLETPPVALPDAQPAVAPSDERLSLKDLFESRAAGSGLTVSATPATGSAPQTPTTPAKPVVREAPATPTLIPVTHSAPAAPAVPVAPIMPEPAPVAAPAADTDRPMVGAAFGLGVKSTEHAKRPAAFDDLIDGDSTGSHRAQSALIFTPSPGVGSLSGPIASTGEMLITGTYTLPEGLGSQGHALGTTDGKEADAVLIDGELAPASSPTPIAASSAVATSKPAGEVIRPPAPDKSNKLMLTLAIVAGGLALALAAALIIAATTGVFG